ncbi:hypothetical protein AX16_010799 [Volvariella volvacea WC 439]|nr:hypothetical protein AX16_010799 [Volvariella volvacea WC 439]
MNSAEQPREQHQLSPIEKCPNEILDRIVEYLQYFLNQVPGPERKKQMLALRLASRRLSAFPIRFVVNGSQFSWYIEPGTDPSPWRISGYGHRQARQPAPEIFIPYITSVVVSFCFTWHSAPNNDSQDVLDQLGLFWDELQRYSSMHSLRVVWDEEGARSLQHAAYRYLSDRLLHTVHQATKGHLSHLYWSLPLGFQLVRPIHLSLSSFHNLQCLELRVFDEYYHSPRRTQEEPQCLSVLGDLILRNPGLRTISLNSNSAYLSCSLTDLFPVGPNELAIEDICIRGVRTPLLAPSHTYFPAYTNPSGYKLRNLRSISINATGWRENRIDLDGLWRVIMESGARLQELSLHFGISDTLMKYLSQYEGLVKAEFHIGIPPASGFPSRASFIEALTRHAPSLTSLSITSDTLWNDNDPLWENMAIDLTSWPVPSQFSNLGFLSVITPSTLELNASNLRSMVDYATEIPQLKELTVDWSFVGPNLVTNLRPFIRDIGRQVHMKGCNWKVIKVRVGEYGEVSWETDPPYLEEGWIEEKDHHVLDDFLFACEDF